MYTYKDVFKIQIANLISHFQIVILNIQLVNLHLQMYTYNHVFKIPRRECIFRLLL